MVHCPKDEDLWYIVKWIVDLWYTFKRIEIYGTLSKVWRSMVCIGVFSQLSILGLLNFCHSYIFNFVLKKPTVVSYFNNYIFQLNQNSYPFYSITLYILLI